MNSSTNLKRSKILVVTHCYPSNSGDLVGAFLYEFLLRLAQYADITVYTPKMNTKNDSLYMHKPLKNLVFFNWLGGDKRVAELKMNRPADLLKLLSMFYHGRAGLKKHLKTDTYDYVLAPWVIPNGFFIASLFRKFKIPFATWALGSDINVYSKKPFGKSLLRYTMKRADTIFVNSFGLEKTISSVYGLNSEMLYTNREIPTPETSYSEDETLRLLWVGRLEEVKGPDTLIDSIHKSGVDNFELTIVGDGSLMDETKQRAEKYGISESVRFLGFQGAQAIANEMKRADYLVISSYSEGMPVVFWESMQCDTPVLSTDVGDVRHYCEMYNVGEVSEISSDSLGALLKKVNENREMRAVLSKRCKDLSQLIRIDKSADTFLQHVKQKIK